MSLGPDPADAADRRKRLELSFAAAGCADLLDILDTADRGTVADSYCVNHLFAAGSQFFVWAATDLHTGRLVVLKQARLDYRFPVRYGAADVERRRAAVRRERDVLWADRSGTLPQPLALVVSDAVVPAAAASPVLARNELFVAEELVHGLTVSELALKVWPGRPPAYREAAAAQVVADFVRFWQGLHAAGWHYGDLSADNLLVEASGKLRVVDGGSAVPAAPTVTLAGYTPAYTTPNLYAAASAGRPVPGSLASVLPLLGKVLHFALTRREPFNGRLPDLAEPALQAYSPLARLVLELILDLDARPDRLPAALDAVTRWATTPNPA